MADAFGQAAGAANAVADATAKAAKPRDPGAGSRASASRRAGGSTSLDFSDPFRAIETAQRAQQQLSRTHATASAGRTQVNAARAFADDVRAAADASINRAIADYTAGILSELNSAGVLNPADRSRIIRERISEAERLGVIPSASSLEGLSAGSLR